MGNFTSIHGDTSAGTPSLFTHCTSDSFDISAVRVTCAVASIRR